MIASGVDDDAMSVPLEQTPLLLEGDAFVARLPVEIVHKDNLHSHLQSAFKQPLRPSGQRELFWQGSSNLTRGTIRPYIAGPKASTGQKRAAAAVHLPKARYAGLHTKPAALPIFIEALIITHGEWARAYEAHVSP